ncbi:YqgE/AlgH family protein [uncultured Amphritea sp.]|uniref:YqgE/AlgH family protein n=1 Tax=uncultured Amphritea sp. TaxID=981605 RepID=UPI00262B20CB|nr:YqgE/AlgH family protein [uncultured Amphritea sp.]
MTSETPSLYLPGSLQGHFLISMPHMDDPNFAQAVIYICEHNASGAMGIIINRPLEIDLNELLQHLDFSYHGDQIAPVYAGGPVQDDRGFILHCRTANEWDSCYHITGELTLTTSMDILQAISENRGPEQFLVALGYAGWGAGQLEQELSENVWLSCLANLDIMFRTPAEERLQAAATTLGVNLDLLTSQSGHA